jgi:hypothetical protein
VAIAEAEAAVAIAAAFDEFAVARASRRRPATTARAGSQLKRRVVPKSPGELGSSAAKAKMAVVYVVVERNRVAETLGRVREELAEMRQSLGAADGDWRRQRIPALEAAEAYLVREHALRAAVADQLLLGLRAIFENLPASAAKIATRLTARGAGERKK